MIGSRLGLGVAIAAAALSLSTIEPSSPRSYQSRKPMQKPVAQSSGNKLAKRKARGKRLFRP